MSPDPAYGALNDQGFAYGAGGQSLRSAWAALRPEGITGFVSAPSFVADYRAAT